MFWFGPAAPKVLDPIAKHISNPERGAVFFLIIMVYNLCYLPVWLVGIIIIIINV